MKTRTKLSIATPLVLLAVLLTANIAANGIPPSASTTATPIKHVVVIYDENTSFDHYFATYPNAANPPNEPQFTAAPGTPAVTGLNGPLLTDNPNAIAAGNPADNPVRIDRTVPVTCNAKNAYTAEQEAYNGGLANMFPKFTGCSMSGFADKSIVTGYYDGNSVTALWNYAQNFALNDNSFGTTFGPSIVGALNVISGLGGPMVAYTTAAVPNSTSTLPIPGATTSNNIPGTLVNGQVITNIDPTFDDCSYSGQPDASTQTVAFAPGVLNVGNLLNTAGLTWGFFEGGFAPTVPYNPSTGAPAQCGESEENVGGDLLGAYSAHYDGFEYFPSTANPHHLPPSSPSMIGYTDQANHQYDISDFWIAADSGNLPAVSYLKAQAFQTGHPSDSSPLNEQTWLVNAINKLMSLPTWSSTAIIINWDDSDGWYDNVIPPIVSPSSDPANDALNGPGVCGQGASSLGVEDRCGYGPRIPILVISPYAKSNYVDNTLATQTSIVTFIEYNWNLAASTPGLLGPSSFDTMAGSILNMFDFNHSPSGDSRLFLNPSTGEPVGGGPGSLGKDNGPNNGVPNLNQPSTCDDVVANPGVCSTENDFANTPVTGSNLVWLTASAQITPRESASATTVYFTGQWVDVEPQGGNGIPLQFSAPNSEVVFSSNATSATTTFTGGQWVTTVPVGFTGNVFIGGLALQPPTGLNLADARVQWQGVFSGTTVSFTLQWQWAAGIYSNLGTSALGSSAFYNALGVKPIANNTGSTYLNNDNAGTPENFKADYTSSLSGQGEPSSQSQFTGQYGHPASAYYQAYLLNE